jgi:hypothetical protein
MHFDNSIHQVKHFSALINGLKRHGIQSHVALHNIPDGKSDLACVWGWRQQFVIQTMRKRGAHVLVLERGFLQDRFCYTSLGFDGLNNRAVFSKPADNGERFDAYWGHLLRPWRNPRADGFTLLAGQVPRDAALDGVDYPAWLADTAARLLAMGHRVRWRPHPNTWVGVRRSPPPLLPPGLDVEHSRNPRLADDLRDARLVVALNSTALVDAALAGVPVVAGDIGAMAWPVAAHGLDAVPLAIRPDRGAWCNRLAWCQWSIEEIEAGDAWDVLRTALPERPAADPDPAHRAGGRAGVPA